MNAKEYSATLEAFPNLRDIHANLAGWQAAHEFWAWLEALRVDECATDEPLEDYARRVERQYARLCQVCLGEVDGLTILANRRPICGSVDEYHEDTRRALGW